MERSPGAPFVMNRGGRRVHLRSAFGDDWDLEVNEDVTLEQLQHEVRERFGGDTPSDLKFSQGGRAIASSTDINPEEAIDFSYKLNGGMGLQVVRSVPELARVHILCNKCGLQHMPDVANGEWCESVCCCLHSECGPKDWVTQQILCVVLGISPFSFSLVKQMPACLKVRVLCFKCGVGDMPDLARDEWSKTSMCCLYHSCGPKDLLKPQILCLRCG